MESLARLIPFVVRQRRALIISIVFSVGAALFAVAQLSLVYPMIKLLLEGKTPNQHVHAELDHAQKIISRERQHLDNLQIWLKDEKWQSETPTTEKNRIKREFRIANDDLSKATWNLALYSWLDQYVVPLLPTDRFNTLAYILGLLLVLTLCKETCSFLQELFVGAIIQRVMQSLRLRLFRNTLRLDQQTLALETTPQLISRFTYDLSQVAHGMLLLGSKIFVEPLKAIICIGCAFIANWRLTLLSFILAPILIALFGGLGKKLKKATQRQMESMSRVYRVLEETLTSIRTVQAYRNERLHRHRLAREHWGYFEKALKILRIDVMVSPSVEFLAMCAVFVASLPGAYLVLRHKTSIWGIQLAAEEMTVSDLGLLYTCMLGVLDPGRKLSGIYSKLKKAATACDRVFAWMDRTSLVKTSPNVVPFPRHCESIELDRVTFHYAQLHSTEPGRRVLDNVGVLIPFGATVAVVGQNGSGKSTLVNLLPRFFDPHTGHVRIDGVDLRVIHPGQLRAQIGVVTQETLLFDRSIAENIRYGKPDATDQELKQAAQKAYVTDFVNQLPEGFATQIGDRGQRLSGGQRQRIALARAIIRDPSILILDEATSAIDTQSEQCIHQTLQSFARDRTTFIVTHAMTPGLLKVITHVLVMDRGKVIAFGPHESVLKTCPEYQRLYEAQTLKRAA